MQFVKFWIFQKNHAGQRNGPYCVVIQTWTAFISPALWLFVIIISPYHIIPIRHLVERRLPSLISSFLIELNESRWTTYGWRTILFTITTLTNFRKTILHWLRLCCFHECQSVLQISSFFTPCSGPAQSFRKSLHVISTRKKSKAAGEGWSWHQEADTFAIDWNVI